MILDLIAAAALAAAISFVACRVLIATGPIDSPSLPRHAHDKPTATSGGLGIALGFAAGLMALALFSEALRHEVTARGASLLTLGASFAYAFMLLGFRDDARPLSARLKFVLFSALSMGVAFALGAVRAFPMGDYVWHAPLWLATVGTALWIFTLVNCVNFMDGANGLAMGSVAIGLSALGFIAFENHAGSGAAAALCAAGALMGFLYWNFPGAKLFAGDSGALFAGALAAVISIIVIHRTGLTPLVPAIIFFPLLADTLLTLAWRAYRRHSLLDGHSEHLYQIAMRGGMSHAEVTFIYWSAMGACAAIGYLVARDPGVAAWLALIVLSGAAIVVSTVVRRFADRRGIGGV